MKTSEIGKQLSDVFRVHFRNADTSNEWRNGMKSYKTEAEAIADAKKIGSSWNECGILHVPATKGGTEWQIVRHVREIITEGHND